MVMTLEDAWADAHCPCHGEPWRLWRAPDRPHGVKRRCPITVREYMCEYMRGFRKTEAGRRAIATTNAKTLRAGDTYLGKAKTPEQAARINGHIAMRLAEFKAQQAQDRKERLG